MNYTENSKTFKRPVFVNFSCPWKVSRAWLIGWKKKWEKERKKKRLLWRPWTYPPRKGKQSWCWCYKVWFTNNIILYRELAWQIELTHYTWCSHVSSYQLDSGQRESEEGDRLIHPRGAGLTTETCVAILLSILLTGFIVGIEHPRLCIFKLVEWVPELLDLDGFSYLKRLKFRFVYLARHPSLSEGGNAHRTLLSFSRIIQYNALRGTQLLTWRDDSVDHLAVEVSLSKNVELS